MESNSSDFIFTKILPVLLSASIVWIMTSISGMQVLNARIEVQVVEINKLLASNNNSLNLLENRLATQQITISLLGQQLESLRKEYDAHLRMHDEQSRGR